MPGGPIWAVLNAFGYALIASPVLAGSITIRTEVTATAKANGLAVAVRVVNSGDEIAHSVIVGAAFRGQTARDSTGATLAPGGGMDVSLDLPWTEAMPGQWPLMTTVDYADANGYPFQAIEVAVVSSPGASPALLAAFDLDASPVATSSSVGVRLKSLSAIARQARVSFLVPRGLEVDIPSRSLPLKPWADAQVEARIINRAALAGSRYPVFVTVEYDDSYGHHAALAHGAVEIRAATPARGNYLFGAAAAMAVVWVVLVVGRRWRRGTAPPVA